MTTEISEIRNKQISEIILEVDHDACVIVNHTGDVYEVHMSEFCTITAGKFYWIPIGPCKKIGSVEPFSDRSWIDHRYQVFAE